jgi:hypothetical protein
MMLWANNNPIAEIISGDWGDEVPVIKVVGDDGPGSCTGELKLKAEMSMLAYGSISKECAKANALFIVRACNNHDYLLECLQTIETASQVTCDGDQIDWRRLVHNMGELARTAITKASEPVSDNISQTQWHDLTKGTKC